MKRAVKAWKLVRFEMGLQSLSAPAGAIRTYRKGRTTRPAHGCGPVTAFRDRESAERYVEPSSLGAYVELWECVALESTEDFSEDKVLWNEDGSLTVSRSELPPGTILATAIRLTRRLA